MFVSTPPISNSASARAVRRTASGKPDVEWPITFALSESQFGLVV